MIAFFEPKVKGSAFLLSAYTC